MKETVGATSKVCRLTYRRTTHPKETPRHDTRIVVSGHACRRNLLQKRLLTPQRESVLIEEEQGANVLFLAIGFLKWFEADNSDVERFAPLILVPVRLDRDRVRSRFWLQRREDDIEVNLSLRAKLKQDFEIELPDLPDDEGVESNRLLCVGRTENCLEGALDSRPRRNVAWLLLVLEVPSLS